MIRTRTDLRSRRGLTPLKRVLPLALCTTMAHAIEPQYVLSAAAPATSVTLLSAPHVGKQLCEATGLTPVRFVKRSNHGPHRYALVRVLSGDCAGVEGYVPWRSVRPEPGPNG